MQRWAPYPGDRPSRQHGTRATEAQSLALSQSQPGDSSASLPFVINDENMPVENHQATSSNHVYHTVNASGNSNLHLGDVHYHANQSGVSIKDQLLSSLHFRQMFMRYDNIDDPHSETFKWIFETPDDEQPEWDCFLDWLNGNGGLYWVSGKPGSGKSVLMKYLAINAQQLLESNNEAVLSLSFWFWEAAHTDLERSMLGCLRSLLWQILQLPEHCNSIVKAIRHNLPFEWTKRRLRDAFNAAVEILLLAGVPILIFLDGLDECGSDGTEMMKFAIGVTKRFPTVMMCVSSRPEPIFQHSLDYYPHLRMQDLNRPDVLAIIQQDLFDAPHFASLVHEKGEFNDLKWRLVWGAQGVLLWIRLVTKDLLQGVADGDTYSELGTRLDKLPPDLGGEQGLYAYMLRRNASNSKTYLAEAAIYCQIACRRRASSVLQYYLATNDSLRDSYLHFKDGWETLHHQLDCARLTRAINARTGGLLEVVTTTNRDYLYPFSPRPARTRDPALVNLLSSYGSHTVEFIHRTAQSYITETKSGQELLASSQKSSLEVEYLVFEAWLVSHMVLPCLESIAPMSAAVLASAHRYFDTKLPEAQSERLKSVANCLARKGYLWLEPYHTRPIVLMEFGSLSGKLLPFMMTDERKVSWSSIFVACNWSCAFDELQQTDVADDPAHLFCILYCLLAQRTGCGVGEPAGIYWQDCCDLLLSYQPGPNYEFTNSFGEQISVFHHILVTYSGALLRESKMPALEIWLQQADNETISRTYGPTMVECSSLFFGVLDGIERELNPSKILMLGHFVTKEYCDLLDDRLAEYCEQHEAPLAAHEGSALVHVLCIWPLGAWKPTMYDLSIDNFQHGLKRLVRFRVPESVGILKFPEGIEGVSSWVETVRLQRPEIKSLIDVFRRLGKNEAQIESFVALEEPRIQQTYDEIIYRNWREWLYGIEDPYLKQHRGIRRPEELGFSIVK